MSAFNVFGVKEELVAAYAFYAAVLLLKTILMIPLTSYYRITMKIFATVEDTKVFGGKMVENQQVERIRRIHLNDMENVYAFVFLGALYLLTGPSTAMALLHFRVFAFTRIAHTVVYFLGLQPWRFYAFLPGLAANASMAIQVILAFC